MYNLAIRKCTSPPLLAPRLNIFKLKFTTPPGIKSPDLLNQRQTCYHLSQRGERGAIVISRKFHGVSNALQCCGNSECRAECGAQFCDILRLPLLTHEQSISDQHPTGKQGPELCCSPRGGVLYGGCPERHPCLPGMI